ncbi:MAG: GGDEF domain-containing protein [Planctomycetaceae bacterium]|nr:GGDEF domain-containing protein [Planctomycetaceae bacterium]
MISTATRFSNSLFVPDLPTWNGGLLIRIHPASPLDRPLELSDRTVLVGRDESAELRLEEDSISRRHAQLFCHEGKWLVRDLNSTNGTYVNEQRCLDATLKSGDRIRFGNQIFKFITLDGLESKYHEVIFKMMTTDGLTQVYNKRFLLDSLERELQQAQRGLQSVCLLMMDLDKFKSINDTFGHLAGDAVLIEFARRALSVLRGGEILARYGGEEFSLLCTPASLQDGLVAAERIRQAVAAAPATFESTQIPMTVSIGVTSYCGSTAITPNQLISKADSLLYKAKQNGRNRVES